MVMKLFRIKIGADIKYTHNKIADWTFILAENRDDAISYILDYRNYYDFVDRNENLDIKVIEYPLDKPRMLPHSKQTDESEIHEW